MNNYVVGFLCECTGRPYPHDVNVALIRKIKPAWQAGRLNGIGGKVEPQETTTEAMCREWQEETGTEWTHWKPLFTLSHIGYEDGNDYILHGFFGLSGPFVIWANRDLNGITAPKEGTIEVHSARALPENTIPNLHWMVGLALDPNVVKPVELSDIGAN